MIRFEKIATAVFICALLLSFMTTWLSLLMPQGPPTWDGSEHSFHGLRIYYALKTSDFQMFKQFTLEQTMWPFLHSWILGMTFCVLSPGFSSARLVSLLLWSMTAVLTFILGRRLTRSEYKNVSGLLAGAVVITSPMFVQYSVQPMLEVPGAFLTMLVMITLTSRNDFKWPNSLAAGCVLGLLFFLKYAYAQLFIASFIGFVLFEIVFRHSSQDSVVSRVTCLGISTISFLTPVIIAAALWFSRSDALQGYLVCLQNPESGLSFWSLYNWILYPVILILYYFASPLMAVVVLAYSFVPQRGISLPARRLVNAYILVSLLILTVYHYKLARAVFTILPFIAASDCAKIVDCAAGASQGKKQVWGRFCIILVVVHLPLLFYPKSYQIMNPLLKVEFRHMTTFDRELQTALIDVSRRLKDERVDAVIGDSHNISPPLISWYLCEAGNVFPRRIPTLLRWDNKLDGFKLDDLMSARGFHSCLVIRIATNSILETQDYIDNYAWMSRRLILPNTENRLKLVWTQGYNNGVSFEYYQRSR